MRTSRGNVFFRGLAAMALAAPLLAGCNDSSPSEPKMAASIAGSWTGTYASNDSIDCDNSIIFPAQATLSQNGSDVAGTLTATGDPNGCPCGVLTFTGTLQGNALSGTIGSSDYSVRGALSGSTLRIDLVASFGNTFGQLNLHR